MTDIIIKYRWFIIIGCLIAGVALGLLIPFSKTDPDIRIIFHPNAFKN